MHATRITHESFPKMDSTYGIRYYAECSCGFERGPFETTEEAREAIRQHRGPSGFTTFELRTR